MADFVGRNDRVGGAFYEARKRTLCLLELGIGDQRSLLSFFAFCNVRPRPNEL